MPRSIVLFTLVALLLGCEQGSPQATPAASAPADGAAQVAGWPPITGAGDTADMAALLRRNYYIILDGSGSMRDQGCSGEVSKFESAVPAVKAFIDSVPAQDNLGLFIFDERGASERVPLEVGNRDQLKEKLSESRPEGGTPLKSAIEWGYEVLTRQASAQLGYGQFNLVIVTDGEASPAEQDPTKVVNRILDRTPITVHTIGYCIGEGHSLNQPGRTRYSTAQDTAGLTRGLRAVLAEAEVFTPTQFQ